MTLPSKPKITLDANCVINLFDSHSATATSVTDLMELMRLGLAQVVDIAVTTRVEDDLLKDKDPKRKAEMLRMLGMFPVVGTIFRWDVTRFDTGDVWTDDYTEKRTQEIQRVLFPGLSETDKRRGNKLNDVDHLVGHIINGRNIFVTDDGDIVRKAATLHTQFGIVVQRPKECVGHVQELEAHRQAPITQTHNDTRYHSAPPFGQAVFDYSNNNGRFTIGTGVCLFETAWSKASDESIHAYSDPPSIDALALAKGAQEFAGIDATTLDYSSRTRTPQIGQIVVWRNVKGIYAATKVTSVKDDTRGDSHDELNFEYRILLDGSTKF